MSEHLFSAHVICNEPDITDEFVLKAHYVQTMSTLMGLHHSLLNHVFLSFGFLFHAGYLWF